jgi:hypothetical protein
MLTLGAALLACVAFTAGHVLGMYSQARYWAGKAQGPMGYRTAVFHEGKFYYVVQEGDREYARELAR